MKRLLPLFAVLAACAPTDDPVAAGRAQYLAADCAACHKIDGRGGSVGPDLSLVGFRHSREWLDRWLESPRHWKADAQMPGFGFDAGTRGAIVAYLASLKRWDGAENGEAIYKKAGCIGCHGPRGSGGHPNNNAKGGVIPAIDKLISTYTREELIEKIRKGAVPQADDPSKPPPLVRMPAWGEMLSDADLEAVAAYLETIAIKPPEEEEW